VTMAQCADPQADAAYRQGRCRGAAPLAHKCLGTPSGSSRVTTGSYGTVSKAGIYAIQEHLIAIVVVFSSSKCQSTYTGPMGLSECRPEGHSERDDSSRGDGGL